MSRGPQGFPKARRLRKGSDFAAVFADPRKEIDRYWVVLFRDTGRVQARLGLAISRRCSPQAVARNRLKRLWREVFRRQAHRLPPVDLVVLCRRPAVEAEGSALIRSIERVLRRLASSPCASSSSPSSVSTGSS